MNRNDSDWVAHRMHDSICNIESELSRPSAMFKPRIFQDGDRWCALYGEDLMIGVAAFGNSPEEAARRFDAVWLTGKDVYDE